MLRWEVRELLRCYRDGHARPAAQAQFNWDLLHHRVLVRDKQITGDEPKPPPILREH